MIRLTSLLICLAACGCGTTYVANKGTPSDEMAANIQRSETAKQDRLKAEAAKPAPKKDAKK